MSVLGSVEVPAATCRVCGVEFSRAASKAAAGEQLPPPAPGDRSICIKCGAVSIFDDQLVPRAPTPQEEAEANADPEVQQFRAALARVYATTCNREGCGREGTHYLIAKVWAKGYPRASHDPITAMISLVFCLEHARAEARSKALVTAEFWQAIEATTAAAGRAKVDRKSLEIDVVRGDPKPHMRRGLH